METLERWLAGLPAVSADPERSMTAAGLLAPVGDYATIGRWACAIATRTGRLDLARFWTGRQLLFRHFLSFGTGAQRAAWAGRTLAVAISEPEVGAHPKKLTTRAAPVGAGWRLDGRKAWVTGGRSSQAVIVFAITAENEERKRYSAFLVPQASAGLSWQAMQRDGAAVAGHDHLTLDGCSVAGDALLGEAGTAYERMALPFRDIEDAAGCWVLLGGLRRTATLPACHDPARPELLGAFIGLTTAFAAAIEPLMTDLDAGRMLRGDSRLVGALVLASHLTERLEAMMAGGDGATAVADILFNAREFLAVARGARIARQRQVGETAMGAA